MADPITVAAEVLWVSLPLRVQRRFASARGVLGDWHGVALFPPVALLSLLYVIGIYFAIGAYHSPGWTIRAPNFEVICWAPGEIRHDGEATGRHRDQWMLSVETGPIRSPGDVGGFWESGGVVSGDSLTEVLAALALLEPSDRYQVTAVLVHQLGPEQRTPSGRDDHRRT